jgi:bacillithiol biosynthesis deacetylase BshB1
MLDVLIVAPHPDDAELGMGGAILKLKAAGQRVGVLDLTTGEPTPRGSEPLRAEETRAASAVLDLDWRENLGLPNRSLEPTLAARRQLAEVIRRVRPRWLFAPYWVDAHPDHVAATELVEAARFWGKLTKTEMAGEPHYVERIYYYYCVHLRLAATPAFVLDISDFWERKLESIRCYHSQFIAGRPTTFPNFLDQLRDDAAHWGRLIGRAYGEPFATREPVALSTLEGLL